MAHDAPARPGIATGSAQQAAAAEVLESLRAYGTHATSFQILEPGYSYWLDRRCEPPAVVAWVRSGRYRVAAGGPIAPSGALGEVVRRFVDEASHAGDRVLFFSADQSLLTALCDVKIAFDYVQIGEQPEWRPADYHTRGRARRTVRAQVNRARNKGVTVRSVGPDELHHRRGALRAEIERILNRWLDSRRMSVMGFLVDLQPFHFPEERRYWVAERGDEAVAFLAAIPVYQRNGWFFEDVIRVPDAPNGTVELLIDRAMLDVTADGSDYVTLGLAPLAGIPRGPGPHRWLRHGLSRAYDWLGGLYQFSGVRSFKARFRPDAWEAQYLVACPPKVSLFGFRAVLEAFAGGGLLSFGLETAVRLLNRIPRRIWAAMLWTLAVLLVPWTALLAWADGEVWFGDPSIQHAWVAFDAAMVLGLGSLGRAVCRSWPGARLMSVFLAGATLTDFVLTAVQALKLHAHPDWPTRIFIGLGMAGPLLATALLVGLAAVLPVGASRGRRRTSSETARW